MNRRIKTEEPRMSCKMTRTKKSIGSKLVNPARSKKKSPIKKKTIKKSKFSRAKGSDDEFEFKVSENMSNLPFNREWTTSRRSLQGASVANDIKPRKSVFPENIYQISDSSDDDDLQIVKYSFKDKEANCVPINLCETDDNINQSKVDILDEILHEVKSNKSYSYPSTSTTQNKNEVPEFVDNLLDSNQDLLDENYLKSLKELSDQNEKLLQSSWNLINNTQGKTFEDSVIFVSPENSPNKPAQNLPEASAVPAPEAEQLTNAEQQIKTSCAICLEKLGSEPVSSTICGHIFCTACIKNCVKSQKKCPTCRKHLTIKMVHPLFLF